jgi:ribosomal protein L37E
MLREEKLNTALKAVNAFINSLAKLEPLSKDRDFDFVFSNADEGTISLGAAQRSIERASVRCGRPHRPMNKSVCEQSRGFSKLQFLRPWIFDKNGRAIFWQRAVGPD